MQHELRTLWTGLRDNTDVNAVILTGAGEKAFCTGIDRLEAMGAAYFDDPDAPQATGHASTPFMYNDPGTNINPKQNDLWKPVIAAVNGMACGGALYMLGEADSRIEVGAGWDRTGERAGPYIALQIDDPALTASLRANLIRSARDDSEHHLLWSRPQPQDRS